MGLLRRGADYRLGKWSYVPRIPDYVHKPRLARTTRYGKLYSAGFVGYRRRFGNLGWRCARRVLGLPFGLLGCVGGQSVRCDFLLEFRAKNVFEKPIKIARKRGGRPLFLFCYFDDNLSLEAGGGGAPEARYASNDTPLKGEECKNDRKLFPSNCTFSANLTIFV